mgnify:CR=1 FL=1|jgi:hypothetical protein|tara:strand:- start:1132 stop:1389 length:258 start_codon:yes stop_codon:yes gene_type:complete
MSISKIQNDIAKGNFSTTELNNLITFIQGVKTSQVKSSIGVGDNVFVVQKTKRTPGVVLSIKIKKAIVEMRGQRYNVPLSMLEAA